jgi:hypothetical protein
LLLLEQRRRRGAGVLRAVVLSNGVDPCLLSGNAAGVVLGYASLFAGATGFTRSVKLHPVGVHLARVISVLLYTIALRRGLISLRRGYWRE